MFIINNILTSSEEESKGLPWPIKAAIAALIIIPLTKLIAPDLIPFSYFGAWDTHRTSLGDWLYTSLPLFAWGLFITLGANLIAKVAGKSRLDSATYELFDYETTKTKMFWQGIKTSLYAGISEEIGFRWLLFYGAFATLAISNWLIFGWAGFGLASWFHLHVWGAVANITTFGFLENWIYYPGTWLVGASLLYANAFFREGHKYLGLLGIINSWFVGMYFFYIMLNYGLLAAIIAHVIYDALIFSTIALMWGE